MNNFKLVAYYFEQGDWPVPKAAFGNAVILYDIWLALKVGEGSYSHVSLGDPNHIGWFAVETEIEV